MATINNTYSITELNDSSIVTISWETITTTNNVGNWIKIPEYPDKTVHIFGNFGTGGMLDIEGSNDGSNAVTLTDNRGDTISKGADYIGMVAENTLYIRPKLSAGSGAVDLDIIVIARRNMRGK